MSGTVRQAEKVRNISLDNFSFSYDKRFLDFVVERMNNKEFFVKMPEDQAMMEYVQENMKESLYYKLRAEVELCNGQLSYCRNFMKGKSGGLFGKCYYSVS